MVIAWVEKGEADVEEGKENFESRDGVGVSASLRREARGIEILCFEEYLLLGPGRVHTSFLPSQWQLFLVKSNLVALVAWFGSALPGHDLVMSPSGPCLCPTPAHARPG
jgi:hypothetical protein